MPPVGTAEQQYALDKDSSVVEMTCEHSKKTSRSGPDSSARICLTNFKASTVASERSLRVTEGEHAFIMPSPKFQSEATFELQGLTPHSHMTVGYIQVVKQRRFRLVYTHGEAEWEFDGVPKNSAISDSDGRLLPFFGVEHEIATFRNGLVEQSGERTAIDGHHAVEMTDEPRAKICWRIPSDVPPSGAKSATDSGAAPAVELRFVERHQKFCTWLAVHDHVNQTLTPVIAVEWQIDLAIDINPSKPVGQRTTWRPVHVSRPEILAKTPPIPWTALHNTRTANMLDKLTWRPLNNPEPVVVVPAAECRFRVLSSPPLSFRRRISACAKRPKVALLNTSKECDVVENKSMSTPLSGHSVRLPSLSSKISAYARKTVDCALRNTFACFLAPAADSEIH